MITKRPLRPGLSLAVALGLPIAAHGASIEILNPSFEANYNPTFPSYSAIDQWGGDGGRGVNEAGGPFHNGGTPIPDQGRVAFLQGTNTLTQNLSGLEAGKQYWLQFHYDARACCGGTIDLSTSFGGTQLDTIANVQPASGGAPYHFRQIAFTPTASSGTLVFSTLAVGDATANLDAVSLIQRDASEVVIRNPSFEASGTIATFPGYSAAIAGWTFQNNGGNQGINSSAGPFFNNGVNPDGAHVALIQNLGALSQVIDGFVPGLDYELTYSYNSREGTDIPTLQVLIGGIEAQTAEVPVIGGANPFHSNSFVFTANAPSMELAFAQVGEGGDRTLLLDDVHIRLIPEPNAVLLASIGAGMLAFTRRRP